MWLGARRGSHFGLRPCLAWALRLPRLTVCYRSAIVRRLLAGGHTVRITCRDPSNKSRLAYLNSLPGAAARLSVFKVPTVSCSSPYSCPAVLGCPRKQANT